MATVPKITWGAAYANTLELGYRLDNAVSWDEDREGSDYVQGASGVEDAWIVGVDYYLQGEARWVPRTTTTTATGLPITGYETTNGWRDFLQWARQKNSFRFFPDRALGAFIDCYLVEPLKGGLSLESDGTRKIALKIRSLSAFNGY